MKNATNMTEGSILRNLIYFAIPVLIGNIFQQLYNVADTAIIPIQDYLGLDNRARINQPSTNGTNWKWRVNKKDLNSALAGRIADLTAMYGRLPE